MIFQLLIQDLQIEILNKFMKDLKTYLEEDLFATSMNTTGMGNPSAPSMDNSQVGSGDVLCPTCIDIRTGKLYKRRKKFRRYKI